MTCPICQKTSEAAYGPFCSRRCSEVDLGRWLTGGYVLPTDAAEEDDTPSDPGSDDGTDGGSARSH